MPRGVKGPPKDPVAVRFNLHQIDREEFNNLVADFGGASMVAKTLRISPELIADWTTKRTDPPYAVMLCLFWLGPHGFQEAFDQAHWTHSFNSFLKNEARARVAALEGYISATGLPMPPGRITTTAESLLAGPSDWLEGEGVEFRKKLTAKVAALHARDAGQPIALPAMPSAHAVANLTLDRPTPADAEPATTEPTSFWTGQSPHTHRQGQTEGRAVRPPSRAAVQAALMLGQAEPAQV